MISVIVPIFNVKEYLNRCIDSIIHQAYQDLQIVLVDDGSTDGGGALCDEYALLDNRIEVIHSKNEGVASARNKGIRRSVGRFLCFVDADDYLELDAMSNLFKEADDRSADVVTCNFNIVYDHSLKVLCRNVEGGGILKCLFVIRYVFRMWMFNRQKIMHR